MQVPRNAGPTGHALVHAQVEAGRVRDLAQHPHRGLGQLGELRGFVHGQVRVVRNMPVGADQEMARVIRIEVEHDVAGPAAVDDQGILVRALGRDAEGAVVLVLELVLAALDVCHAVRSPQALEGVRHPGEDKVVGCVVVARVSRDSACGLLHVPLPR